ncbi:hypothetical protein ACMUMQ_06330 [Marinomonas sp. 2405UD66-6]|uniref:hypothetical protein n=1 Tax=Marinomonas sp. 2405UD66-6 TaxID=3391834 RepID=UPI0039C951A3
MGIVVTIFMALILFLSIPNPVEKRLKKYQDKIFAITFLMGAWNAFWYGAQHFDEFWGIAALISGFAMMITSLPNISLDKSPSYLSTPLGWLQTKINSLPQGFQELMLLMLLGCACIYGYTLIQLNLA